MGLRCMTARVKAKPISAPAAGPRFAVTFEVWDTHRGELVVGDSVSTPNLKMAVSILRDAADELERHR